MPHNLPAITIPGIDNLRFTAAPGAHAGYLVEVRDAIESPWREVPISPGLHEHDYAPLDHNHDTAYAEIGHGHAEYAATVHDHPGKADADHDHDADYSAVSHTHDDRYERLAGLNYRGDWDAAEVYAIDDVAAFAGINWRCKLHRVPTPQVPMQNPRLDTTGWDALGTPFDSPFIFKSGAVTLSATQAGNPDYDDDENYISTYFSAASAYRDWTMAESIGEPANGVWLVLRSSDDFDVQLIGPRPGRNSAGYGSVFMDFNSAPGKDILSRYDLGFTPVDCHLLMPRWPTATYLGAKIRYGGDLGTGHYTKLRMYKAWPASTGTDEAVTSIDSSLTGQFALVRLPA